MAYLLAAIGMVTFIVLLWKAFGAQHSSDRRPVLAPDDDPEFLRGLSSKRQDPDEKS